MGSFGRSKIKIYLGKPAKSGWTKIEENGKFCCRDVKGAMAWVKKGCHDVKGAIAWVKKKER